MTSLVVFLLQVNCGDSVGFFRRLVGFCLGLWFRFLFWGIAFLLGVLVGFLPASGCFFPLSS